MTEIVCRMCPTPIPFGREFCSPECRAAEDGFWRDLFEATRPVGKIGIA